MFLSNCGENDAKNPKIWSPNIPVPWREDNEEAKEEEDTIHFTACDENVKLLLKMVISVNQLSLYGAVADLIKELPDDQRAPGKLVGLDQMEEEFLTQPPLQKWKPMTSDSETYCKITNKDLKNYQKTRGYPNCAPKQV